ncbi:hypothetical protein DAEQUDRAFT_724447 [Daedalea quercina L-15889]|uniref:Uncharacterized protein n=1 Tax=Daedalea quercina L-15889 TaxID=1314783 RepID=A0A165RRW5_9APHY|nr:hypothetical protein DAEQUDRAFT_724447 [Daedalea quercina L-15889]
MSSELPRKCFLRLSTGVQDQALPLCRLEFRGRDHEPGVLLCQFMSTDRGRIVCEGLDHVFEHDCLDE